MALRKGPSKPCSRSYLNFPSYLGDVCLWPKADIGTQSKSVFLNVRFGESSGRSGLWPGLVKGDSTRFWASVSPLVGGDMVSVWGELR